MVKKGTTTMNNTRVKLTSATYMHGKECTCKSVTLSVNKTELKALWKLWNRIGFSEIEVIEGNN